MPIPEPRSRRLLYAIVTIVLPIVCFALAYRGVGPDWQSGRLADYTMIMLGGEVSKIFYPFLLYSMLCMLLLLISLRRFSRYFIVRFGIYSGVVLSLQFAVITGISLFHLEDLFDVWTFYFIVFGGMACAIPVGINWLYEKARDRFGSKRTWYVIAGLCICAWIMVSVSYNSSSAPAFILFIVILACAPLWCLSIALTVSIRLFRHYELDKFDRVWRGLWVITWTTPFLLAWRVAVSRTLEIYALLPTSPPDCYVATAAARGHPGIVRSRPVARSGGRVTWVNPQMQHLKCAELTLMAMFPRTHRLLRQTYDLLGPWLARFLLHPILADVAYVLLKPIEWGARVVMKALVPNIDEIVDQTYTKFA